ncbi:hypothetical protein ACTFIU_008057 [Dictyostelium citrinum]
MNPDKQPFQTNPTNPQPMENNQPFQPQQPPLMYAPQQQPPPFMFSQQQQQQQQQQHSQIQPQQNYPNIPQNYQHYQPQQPLIPTNVMAPNLGKMIQHSIEPEYECMGNVGGFKRNLMPYAMENYLTYEEYSSIVTCLDDYIRGYRKFNLYLTIGYIALTFILLIVMLSLAKVAPAVTGLLFLIFIIVSCVYLAWIMVRLGSINKGLAHITTKFNNEYGNRHIKIEAFRTPIRTQFIVKAHIYYPQTVKVSQTNINQVPLQFIKTSSGPYSPHQKEEKESETSPLL